MMEDITILQVFLQWGIHLLLFLILGISLLFFFEPFFAGELSFLWDTRVFGFPYLNFVSQNIVEGNFPLWNMFNFSGYPFMGDIENMMFYPGTWLFTIFFGVIEFEEIV